MSTCFENMKPFEFEKMLKDLDETRKEEEAKEEEEGLFKNWYFSDAEEKFKPDRCRDVLVVQETEEQTEVFNFDNMGNVPEVREEVDDDDEVVVAGFTIIEDISEEMEQLIQSSPLNIQQLFRKELRGEATQEDYTELVNYMNIVRQQRDGR